MFSEDEVLKYTVIGMVLLIVLLIISVVSELQAGESPENVAIEVLSGLLIGLVFSFPMINNR